MGIGLATGAGAAGGLEELLTRFRAEEELNQHQQALNENVRAHQADEQYRREDLQSRAADRQSAAAALDVNRKSEADNRNVDNLVSRIKLRAPGSEVSPTEYNQETSSGAGPQSLYDTNNVPFGQDFTGPVEGDVRPRPAGTVGGVGPKRGQSIIKFLGTADQQAKQDAQQTRDENAAKPTGAAASADKLVKVEHQDENGKTIIEWLPESELRGKTYRAPTPAATLNRVASAESVNNVASNLLSKLSDPAYASKLGPIMGRFSSMEDFIGNPPPEYSDLVGEIESYALANMGVHGMRSAQGAEMIKKLLSGHHTPESLAATIKGLQTFSTDFVANQKPPKPGGKTDTTTAAPQAPDLSGLKAGSGRQFSAGPFSGQTWSLGPDGKPKRVK